jgi:hypothetical protein
MEVGMGGGGATVVTVGGRGGKAAGGVVGSLKLGSAPVVGAMGPKSSGSSAKSSVRSSLSWAVKREGLNSANHAKIKARAKGLANDLQICFDGLAIFSPRPVGAILLAFRPKIYSPKGLTRCPFYVY